MSARQIYPEILLLLALGGLSAAFAWAAWRSSLLPLPGRFAVEKAISGDIYKPAEWAMPVTKTASWAVPSGQASGDEWVYEVFTPPEIYYHAGRGEFSIGQPGEVAEVKGDGFGLELVAVRREPFRLQLVGFVGGDESYLGTFENALTTEHFLARGGRSVPALAVTIMSFGVERRNVDLSGGMPVTELVATALVRDERTGEEIALNSRERCYGSELVATFAAEDTPHDRIDLRPGEMFRRGEITYKLRQIRLLPPAAELSRESPDSPLPETKTLTPRQ